MEIPASGRLGVRLILALLLTAQSLSAQVAGTLDGTLTRIAYDEGVAVTGASLSPSVQLLRPWQAFYAGGSITRFPDDVWSVQGHLAGSAFLAPVAGLRPELDARVRGTRHEDGGGSGELAGTARLHWLGVDRGLWLGAGGGRASDGSDWRGTIEAEIGGWMRTGPGTLSLSLTGWRVGSAYRYAEIESAYRLQRGPLEFTAFGGLRHWLRPGDASADGWGGASASWWLGDRLAVTLAGGAYPADFGQGLPAGTFGSIGARIATGRLDRARRASEPLDLIIPPALAGERGTALSHQADGTARLTIGGVPGSRLELMGDFTSWEPVPLTREAAGRWMLEIRIPPGIHRVNIRADGGAWVVPPGLPVSEDEFGGAAGVLIVAEPGK
ncbi:MAG TPA: glycogen-binding domain-containing protein [Gemmatimonadales bacterium]